MLVFSVAWVVYCLINTGYVVTQPKWREKLKQSPGASQILAGDIFNHAAFYIKDTGLPRPPEAVLFVQKDLGFLSALPLGYWLYPSVFTPASNNPLSEDNSESIEPAAALKNLVAKSDKNTIYFVGTEDTLKDDQDVLVNYKKTLVVKEGNQVFYILEKK